MSGAACWRILSLRRARSESHSADITRARPINLHRQPAGGRSTATMQAAEVTRTAKIWLDADGILRINTFPGLEDTLDDAKQNVAVCAKVAAGKRRPILIDMRNLKAQGREVRAYYTGPERTKLNLAVAILVESPMSRVYGLERLCRQYPRVDERYARGRRSRSHDHNRQSCDDTLLQGIAAAGAEVVLLDITGVPIVDTQVANTLI